MDEQSRKCFEYETQHFSYSSDFFSTNFKSFIEDSITNLIESLVKNIEKKLISVSKNPDNFKESLHSMRKELEKEYKKSIDIEYEAMKECISKYMNIPEHVLLKEDLPVKTQSGGRDGTQIEAEVNKLKGQLKALICMKKEMEEEAALADLATFILKNIIPKDDIDFNILNANEIVSLAKSNLSLVK